MPRSAVAIVTGFTADPVLVRKSFAPLRSLKAKGLIERIVYLTWDTAEVDAATIPLAGMPDVEFVRVPQPDVAAKRYQNSLIYQRRNIEAALAPVPDEATRLNICPCRRGTRSSCSAISSGQAGG